MANALNAKNLPFTQPGAGLALGGVTDRNLYAKYDKLRGVRDEKAGGSRQLWQNLSRYTTTPQAAKLDPEQGRLFNEYMQTGVKPAGLLDATASRAMDWGLREAGRFQQHKPISLLEKIAGPVLTIAASAIPVIGPYAGAAVGAYMGQRNGGGALGGLLGAAGGYMGGTSIANAGGVSGIANSIKNGVGNFLGTGGGFSNPSALGLSGSNLGLNFASAPGGFAAAPVAGYGASGLGMTGANLGLNFASGAIRGLPVAGYGNSAIGGDAASLYTPQSMGPPKPSIGDRILDVVGNLPGLPGAQPGGGGGGGSGPAISGPTETPPMALPPPGAPPPTNSFDVSLMGAGKAPANALAMSGMGAGLLPDRGMGRVPGYQLRPFANYLMRP
jgi:hypothetical protein